MTTKNTAGLGVLLTGFIVLVLVGNLSSVAFLMFARDEARAADPLAPEWSFLARAIFSFLLGGAAVAMLRKRRVGLWAFYVPLLASLPLNLGRGRGMGWLS